MKRVIKSLKTKILLLSIIPLVLVTAAITVISLSQAKKLSEQEIQTFEENLLRSKRQELQHYVGLAMTSISHILADADTIDKFSEARVKAILHSLTYGDDGYFLCMTCRAATWCIRYSLSWWGRTCMTCGIPTAIL
ncbi:hypothetical protein [Aliamphritea spongicola]|nr:hypothetical protein [Aliamphritea spongicola]